MARAAEDRLRELAATVELPFRGAEPADGPGGAVAVGADQFVMTCRRASDAASIVGAIRRALDDGSRPRGTRPLLCVLHMGPAGRKLCAEAGLGWFDLSGNGAADTHPDGRSAESVSTSGRQAGSSRRRLADRAVDADQYPTSLTFRDLVARSGLGKGYVSRIVAQMVASGLVSEVAANTYRALDPEYLLEAWRDSYALEAHARLVGVVPPAEGPTNLRRIATGLAASGVRTVATGLAGAWLLRRRRFRLTTLYVDRFPSADELARLSFREAAARRLDRHAERRGLRRRVRVRPSVRASVQVLLDLADTNAPPTPSPTSDPRCAAWGRA
jgi:hypothetical protein